VRGRLILDTGPLVAFLNRHDRYHEQAKRRLAEVEPPVLSCEAVLTEACDLLRATSGEPDAVFALLDSGPVIVPFRPEEEVEPLCRLLACNRDLTISLADTCLSVLT